VDAFYTRLHEDPLQTGAALATGCALRE